MPACLIEETRCFQEVEAVDLRFNLEPWMRIEKAGIIGGIKRRWMFIFPIT
jgi:hypothetical protein